MGDRTVMADMRPEAGGVEVRVGVRVGVVVVPLAVGVRVGVGEAVVLATVKRRSSKA